MNAVWPQDYQNWTGNFDQLLNAANIVLSQLDPNAKPLTARTLRHYQQTQVVGRGSKQGRSASFDFKDLSDVVATKNLVKEGWTLNHTSALLNSPEYEPTSYFSNSQASVSDASKNAINVVSGLLAASSSSSPSNARGFAASNSLSAAIAPKMRAAISSPQLPEPVHVYAVSPGVSLHCSPQWLATATVQEKSNAFSQLEQLVQQLKSAHS